MLSFAEAGQVRIDDRGRRTLVAEVDLDLVGVLFDAAFQVETLAEDIAAGGGWLPTGHGVLTENITLDGVIDATEGWFDPAGADSDVDQSDVEAALREQREAADAFLVGRVTFEQMRG